MPSAVLDFLSRMWCRHRANIVALLFMLFSLWINTVLGTLSHERTQINASRLPDIGFDYLPELPESIAFTEFYITIQNVCFFVVLVFQSDREIILRRFMLIMGVLYYFRCISFSVTQFPPSTPANCLKKLRTTGLEYVQAILQRSFFNSITFGFVTQQTANFCGDFLYSGHTVTTLLIHLFINTYYFGRRRDWFNWVLSKCHQAVTSCAILCILLSRQHYTLDIFIAYYVTTQLFWTYHSICLNPVIYRLIEKHYDQSCRDYNSQLVMISTHHNTTYSTDLSCSPDHWTDSSNFISNSWWWALFVYLEIKHKPPRNTSESSRNLQLVNRKQFNQNV